MAPSLQKLSIRPRVFYSVHMLCISCCETGKFFVSWKTVINIIDIDEYYWYGTLMCHGPVVVKHWTRE